LSGTLVGLGAGYGVPWIAATMTPGIGMVTLPNSDPGLGIVPVEEGQIDTAGMPAGTYVLKLIPDDGFGMNVLRGDGVDFTQDQQSYATGAEQVNGDTITFFLQTPKPVLQTAVSRKTHTGAGDWEIDVGIGDIECRSAQLGTANPNELKIIADFDPAVTPEIDLLGGSDVTTDNGTVNLVFLPIRRSIRRRTSRFRE